MLKLTLSQAMRPRTKLQQDFVRKSSVFVFCLYSYHNSFKFALQVPSFKVLKSFVNRIIYYNHTRSKEIQLWKS